MEQLSYDYNQAAREGKLPIYGAVAAVVVGAGTVDVVVGTGVVVVSGSALPITRPIDVLEFTC